MTKLDIADTVAQAETISKRQAVRIVERIFAECQHALEQGDRVTLPPFGTFVIRERKAREGRNPKTGAAIDIPERRAVVFVPAKGLKDGVSGKRRSKKDGRRKEAKP
ncbi:MAG TPA: HU family DNA-binding protein [Candidatus Baltobacteraceae bacterium]|nr:HU family DNA-binding protein [Candidatus Baltobacteraceae bacterium]